MVEYGGGVEATESMNWLDFVILGLMAWFTLTAFLSGFIRETVGLVAVVAAIVLAGLLHDDLAANLTVFTEDETALRIIAFVAIFAVVAIAGAVAGRFLHAGSELLLLGWADRAGGAVFGFLKAVLVVQALTIIFIAQPALGMDQVIEGSAIGSFFLDTAPFVRALLPGEFDRALTEFTA